MSIINDQPWQYCCYWDERAREIWNRSSENFLESLVQTTQVALAALACLFTFTFESMLVGLSLAYRWIYPIETVAPPAVVEEQARGLIELDEFHGLVDVHAPDGMPDEWLIEELNRAPYAEPPADLERVRFFRDAMQAALGFIAPHARAYYVDLFRNEGVPEEGDARIDIYTYSAGCLIAHYCRYPIAHRDQDPIYAAFQQLPLLDKALVLLRLIAPEKDWRLTELAINLIQRIQEKAHNMSQDQFFLREVMAPAALDPALYPLEP
jgi:hypothetical protein